MKKLYIPLIFTLGISLFACGQVTPTSNNSLPISSSESSSSSAEPVLASKKGDIDDVLKTYFKDTTSSVSIDLTNYVNSNGTDVTYEVTSSDTSVASVDVVDNTLTATLLKGEGYSNIQIDVKSNDLDAFSLDFTLTAREFSKIACVGDSLTWGHNWNPNKTNETYPRYLNEGMGIETVNCGVNGATITGYGGSGTGYNYAGGSKTSSQYQKSLTSGADVIVIMLGSNDGTDWTNAAATFEEGYRSLINTYLNLEGVEEVILVASPPVLDGNAFSLSNTNIKTYVNPIQRTVASDLDLPLIDARAEFEKVQAEDATRYSGFFRPNDGVHFTVEGAKFIASLVEEMIRSL